MPFYFIGYDMYQVTFILPTHATTNEFLNALYMYQIAEHVIGGPCSGPIHDPLTFSSDGDVSGPVYGIYY